MSRRLGSAGVTIAAPPVPAPHPGGELSALHPRRSYRRWTRVEVTDRAEIVTALVDSVDRLQTGRP